MEQQELAKHLRVSFQHMNNLEANRRKFTREHARTLDRVFGTDEHFEALWVHSQREHDQEWFQKFTSFERRAREIKIWQPLVIPGLFQTAQYARALLESARTPDAEAVVEFRMKRQEILEREDPPRIFALIDERALRQPAPGPEAMREQLHRLLGIAALPHVIIQVVPMTTWAHIGLDGGFAFSIWVKRRGKSPSSKPSSPGGSYVTSRRSVPLRYGTTALAKALSEEDSVRLIRTIMEQME